MSREPKDDGLQRARLRFSYLFGGLIGFLVVFGAAANRPVDISVLGLLVGGLVTLLGIEVTAAVAKAVAKARGDDPKPNSDEGDDNG